MEPIAVVGVGCVLPGALSAEAYWKNLLAGHVSLGPVPREAWDHALHLAPDRAAPDRTAGALGGFVTDFQFDWRRFRVPPADAAQVNPLQWMVLEAGTQALTQAGKLPQDTTALFIGSTGLGWQKDQGLRIRLDDMLEAVRQSEPFARLGAGEQDALLELASQRLKARLLEVSEDNVVGASASVALGRLNMHFDLRGPHYALDAGFASSLAALDVAVRGLRDGEWDVALAGGVSERLSPLEFIAFSKLGGLSTTGIRPFAEGADGTVLGEGVALFALKRLGDAERDGNRILALVRGVGGSSDGRGKSLVAPNPQGQALAMRRALEDAGLAPQDVDYVECHATGTPVGDASEVQALARVYGGEGARGGRVALGSVKANLGHLRAGAGAAGLLKAVLALEHGVIPPQPSCERVSARLELEKTPFFVPQAATPFAPGRPPRAAVSAFSFGGNNFHAVLEAYRGPELQRRAARPLPAPEPLAVVGVGGRFPGADSVPDFWQRLLEGMDRTQGVPEERWDIRRYLDPSGERRDKSYTNVGCFLGELPPPRLTHRIPPAAWASLDPSHVLTLLATEEALSDAGFAAGKWDADRVGMALAFLPYQGKKFLADIRVNWREFERELRGALETRGVPAPEAARLVEAAEARFKAGLPPITEDTLTGYLGSLNAGRIAHLYDFHGPHFVVDSACASGHAALHAAAKLLRHREADVVLTGGVWADMQPEFFIAACRFNALSRRGSFPFDASADGFIPGEGAGMLVLKRLSDAEKAGDRIRAVVKSVMGSSDGRGRSVLAPSPQGEQLAMRRALEAARVPAASVAYVECHGTGTALGDVVEANAAAEVYGAGGRAAPLLIGSVKSNIGHLNAAAGIAGLLKATLAVETGTLPASLKVAHKNPKLSDGVDVVRATQPFPAAPGEPRRAGVSAFGVGGTNFHAVLEEYRPRAAAPAEAPRAGGAADAPQGPPRLLAFAADSAEACLERLEAHLASAEALCDTDAVGQGGWRLALTAAGVPDARRKAQLLRHALDKGATGGDFLARSGVFLAGPDAPLAHAPVAFTYPGQGGQYPNMLRPLAAEYPQVQATLDEADRAYVALCGKRLTDAFFTDDPKGWRQSEEDIHAAVFAVNVALARLFRAHGIQPAVHVGQSAGELAALVASGRLALADGLAAIRARTLAVLALPAHDGGKMAALACGAAEVPALVAGLPGYAALAADNGPRACIVSADARAMAGLQARCAERGVECTLLAVSHGYHSQLIADARGPYRAALERLVFASRGEPVVSTIDGADYTRRAPAELPDFLASQFVEPVRLSAAMRRAHALGARVFLEAGPKWGLTQFTRDILSDLPHGASAAVHPKVGELEQFKRLLAFCFVHGLGQLRPDAATPSSPEVHDTMPPEPLSPPPAPADVRSALLSLPLAEVLPAESALALARALGHRFGVDAGHAHPQDLASLDAIAAHVEGLRAPPHAAAAPAVVAAAAPQDTAALEAEVQRVLLATVVEKTGYPEEMLGLDLDLEADLGIDTVKQVDVFGRVRTHFGLERDARAQLRDFNTLRKVVQHISERLAQARASRPVVLAGGRAPVAPVPAAPAPRPPPAPAPVLRAPVAAAPAVAFAPPVSMPAAEPVRAAQLKPVQDPSAEVQAVVLRLVVEKTGYPEEMLGMDLDLEADLGIDTVKQVDIFGRARDHFGLVRDPRAQLRDFNTLRKVVDHLAERLVQASPAPSAPSAPAAPRLAPVVAAAAAPQRPVAPPPPAASEVHTALLGLSLTGEAGLSAADVQRLAGALARRLGVAAPDTRGVDTLEALLARMAGA